MKKLMFFAAAILFSSGIAAQETKSTESGIAMKDGKVWIWENGQKSAVVNDKVLSNGTKVTAAGAVTLSDGTYTTLNEGDKVALDGTITRKDPAKKPVDTKLPK